MLNNTLMNDFPDFILNKFANLSDKILTWMSEYLKNKFKCSTKIYEDKYNKNDKDNKNVDNITLEKK